MRAIAAGALLALVTPAFAAETFYVEQDTATKRCRVVSELYEPRRRWERHEGFQSMPTR